MVLPIQLFKSVDCRLKKLEKKNYQHVTKCLAIVILLFKISIQIITKLIVKRVF